MEDRCDCAHATCAVCGPGPQFAQLECVADDALGRWHRAVEARQCVAAMLVLARWAPRDVCWAIVCRLVLSGSPGPAPRAGARALAIAPPPPPGLTKFLTALLGPGGLGSAVERYNGGQTLLESRPAEGGALLWFRVQPRRTPAHWNRTEQDELRPIEDYMPRLRQRQGCAYGAALSRWRCAVEARQCVAAMLGLARWLPRDLCWGVIHRLVLSRALLHLKRPSPSIQLRASMADPRPAIMRATDLLEAARAGVAPRVYHFGLGQTADDRAALLATVSPAAQECALHVMYHRILDFLDEEYLDDGPHAGQPLGYFMATEDETVPDGDEEVRHTMQHSYDWRLIAHVGVDGLLVDFHGWPGGGEDGAGVFRDAATGGMTIVFTNSDGSLEPVWQEEVPAPGAELWVEHWVEQALAAYGAHRETLMPPQPEDAE